MSYWEDRQEELYKQLEKDEERLKKRLSSFYSRESRKLENQIASYYTKYGENKVIEYRKMMEKLDDDDIRLLMERMDEFAEKYPQYAHLMPVRESIYKLNRLEGLQTSIKMQQLEIGAINNEELEKHLTKNAHRAVNAAAETLGFGKNFYSIDSNTVKKFVGIKWSNGKNFSDRIWGNTEKLANYLNTDVAQGFARGDSYQRIMKQMKERFESVSRNDMYRLIYTEGTYVMAEATINPFEEDFEEYKISTAGDSKVCPVCRKVSEKVFKITERKAGFNFPPFHAWCRCSFIPYVEDWEKWMDDYVEKHKGKKEVAMSMALNIKQDKLTLKVNYDEIFNLSSEEKIALNRYISSDSYKINDKLRRGITLNESDEIFIENLNKALDKMPIYKGKVTRDLTFMFDEDFEDFLEEHQINESVPYTAFTSGTTNKIYSENAHVRIIIESKNGRDISMYNTKEKEVLFKNNTLFNVSKIENVNDIIVIYMEEL